jgi:2-polyprenyl-6-methoxyphenol hydroxylase-like FAD-dependent oxidoreductase
VTVLIAGVGMAGLALGLTLDQLKIPLRIYERVPELKPLGVGINLQPNAIRQLFDFGLEREFDAIGVRSGPPDAMAALLRGEKVDASALYFRTAITLETTDSRHDAMNTQLFLATGTRLPEHVLLKIYAV